MAAWLWAEDGKQLALQAAERVLQVIKRNPGAVLLLPTGATPIPLYEALSQAYGEGRVSFKEVKTFNLDEYVGIPVDHCSSYHYYMKTHFFSRTDIFPENTDIPNGNAQDLHAECQRYDEAIAHVGGIDLAILGVGVNGHIGFNEPGSPWYLTTHVVDLTESTRAANRPYFDVGAVPARALTVGIKTILEAREILLLGQGVKKIQALKLLREGAESLDWPLTSLQHHSALTVIAENALQKHL